MKRILLFVNVVVLAFLAPGVTRAQSNPFAGTWKLNVAKSKYTPGPGPQSQTRTIEVQGDGIKVSNEGMAADGSRVSYSYSAKYDGKDNPISGTGVPNGADTIAIKRVDANTTEVTLKKAGKVAITARNAVSKDGKVTTVTAKGMDAKGKPTSNAQVWDRQ